MTGNTAVVEQHVGAGTDLESKEDNGGGTPLILAAIFWEKAVAESLLDAGANLVRNTTPAEPLFIRRASFVIPGVWRYC